MMLLKIGDAAQILGMSRQHVVDLCDRGVLPSVRFGTHRRIPQVAVEEFAQPPLTREEEKSLWLHHALLTSLLSNPDKVLATARDNLTRWKPEQRGDGMTVRTSTSGRSC